MQTVARIPYQALSTVGRPGSEDLFFFLDTEYLTNSLATLTSIDNAGNVVRYAPQTGFWNWAGTIANANTNPNYPAADKGDAFLITTTSGRVGGASGKNVSPGDVVIATATNVGGTEGAVGSSWDVIEGQDNFINKSGADASANKVTVGAQNTVSGDRSMAYGKANNVTLNDSAAFGDANFITSERSFAQGESNVTTQSGPQTTKNAFLAGKGNEVDADSGTGKADNIAIVGGEFNTVLPDNTGTGTADNAAILGGTNNTVNNNRSAIVGGATNTVIGEDSAIIGAITSQIDVDSARSTIIAGELNTIQNAQDSSIISGNNQTNIEGATALGQEIRVTDNVKINYGADKPHGEGALVAGTVTIANAKVTATSSIFLTRTGGVAANYGFLTVTPGAGTFDVDSDNVLDTSTFNFLVINR